MAGRSYIGSLSRRQKALASALAVIPLTISGIFLLKCGCPSAAFTIEILVGVAYFVWVLL
jgi:hypothetical protein